MNPTGIQIPGQQAPDPAKPAEATVSTLNGGKTTRVEVSPEQPKPESKPAGDKPAGDRPAWLPEKFKTPEDMAKSYADLEKKLGQQKPEDKPEDKPAPKPEDKPEGDKQEKAAKSALARAGLSLADLSKEYDANDKLSDETYAKLEAAGFDREIVDEFIDGRLAKREVARAKFDNVFAVAGGSAEAYGDLMSWAAENLTAAEAKAYNAVMATNDIEAIKGEAAKLYARYQRAEGKEPTLVHGRRPTNSSGVVPFKSAQELAEAMRDPRYQRGDKAYHDEIDARLRVSNY